MKGLLLLVILGVSDLCLAETASRTDIRPKHYNEILKNQYELSTRLEYNSNGDSFYFNIKEYGALIGFGMSREQADTVMSAIEKYIQWTEKAIKNEVTLKKQIDTINLPYSFWQVGKGDRHFSDSAVLRMYFFSQSAQTHQFVFVFPRFKDIENEYLEYTPNNLFFDYKEAVKFRDALSRSAVKKLLIEAKKQAEIEDGFN